MKTQILQGINFENSVTTIKIHLEQDVEPSLVQEIGEFHPIFLKDYTILNDRTIIIQSKLPHLWKSIAKILNKEIPLTEKRTEILTQIIKKQIKSMSTISVLDVADKLNEEITPFLQATGSYERQYNIGCGYKSANTTSFSSSKDSGIAKKIQMDKYLTNLFIQRLNLPIAKWELINSEEHLKEIFAEYKKPVVVKPTSLTAGHGVHTNITNIQKAIDAYYDAKGKAQKATPSISRHTVMIQEQVQGEDYRFLLINGVLEAVTKRIPAFIKGNGTSTIKELIEETNSDPRRNILDPTHILKPIQIDKTLLDFLEEQNLTLSYIPKNDEILFVRKVASMSQGGTTIDYTDQVHKHMKYVTESIAQSIKAYTLGIDIMCQDISKPLDIENGSIIEMNTMPEVYLNLFPVEGQQRPEIAQRFVEGLLENKKDTRKIVIIGQNLPKDLQLLGNTGIYKNNAIYINDELINDNIEISKAIESLKINSYLQNIILHYETLEEPLNYGLGFDKIDELYFEEKHEQEILKLDKSLIKKYEVFNN